MDLYKRKILITKSKCISVLQKLYRSMFLKNTLELCRMNLDIKLTECWKASFVQILVKTISIQRFWKKKCTQLSFVCLLCARHNWNHCKMISKSINKVSCEFVGCIFFFFIRTAAGLHKKDSKHATIVLITVILINFVVCL